MKKCCLLLIVYLFQLVVLAAQSPTNVLFIIADDLGIDALEGFGIDGVSSNNLPTTPHINALKQSGISYLNAWATPVCTSTRASIISGKYGVKTGVMSVPGNLGLVHESIFSYLDRMTNNTYSTAVIGKWHISQPVNVEHPLQHGVDHFEGVISGGINDYYSWGKVENGQNMRINEYVTSHLTNAAIDWIADQSQPWFLWLSHIAPHSPFQVPPADLYSVNNPTTDKQIYNASIEALDHEIGRLIASLDEETRNNTLIVFIGDNGTPNNVLGGYPNRHAKGSLFEGGLRVPMVISGTGVSRMGEQEFGLAQVNDLYATIIEVCSNPLAGGIYNSYSLKPSFTQENAIERNFIYADNLRNGTESWAIRNQQYKLIENENGNQEFYNIENSTDELNNLIQNISAEEAEILSILETEADIIRNGWSKQDFILNGDEQTIDDITENQEMCDEVDELSSTNIGCCDTPDEPSVYYEFEENNMRHIYSNGFPNHNYCYNPNNIPSQSYHYFRVEKEPVLANTITPLIRDNGRPARDLGVALNGVLLSPAPGTPFIYVNKNTGEFNWDWVFEPTNNQGDERGQVKLDCATAHTNASGYHYHGEMFEYLETDQPGITSATTLSELYQVAWASDGHPILYKFGPDAEGNVKELQPSFQLKEGERPGDGVVAPCGPYTGKYTVDYEYIEGLGDLDECNGIAAELTLETVLGVETFGYYYVLTSSFPQLGRCLKGRTSADFEIRAEPVTGVDMDGDGYLSQFECDDSDSNLNPSAIEVPNNGIDENCDGVDLISSTHQLANTTIDIFPNPTDEYINIEIDDQLSYHAFLYDLKGKLIHTSINENLISVHDIPAGTYLLELMDIKTREKIVEKIIIGK